MEQVIALLRDYGLQILATVVIGYLVGSVSFSIIFTRLFDKKDIRTMGSGNAGFTNVLRSVGKLPSILTFIFDFAKGLLAVYLGMLIFQASGAPFIVKQCGIYLAGVACILGHVFPLYFHFKGGKGVLTSAALILIIDCGRRVPDCFSNFQDHFPGIHQRRGQPAYRHFFGDLFCRLSAEPEL